MRNLMTRDAFGAAARAFAEQGRALPASRAPIAKDFAVTVKAEGDGPDSRTLRFTISTDAIDSYRDSIDQAGWKLDRFRRNPVVLWQHNGDQLPVAKAEQVWIEDGVLKALATFPPADLSPFGDRVFRMLQGGFLNATSVGFLPLKYAFAEAEDRPWGIDFLEQELLEFSIVSVPANAEALIEQAAPAIDQAAAPAAWRRTAARARLDLDRRRLGL